MPCRRVEERCPRRTHLLLVLIVILLPVVLGVGGVSAQTYQAESMGKGVESPNLAGTMNNTSMDELATDSESEFTSSLGTSDLPRVTTPASFGVTYQGTIAQLQQSDSYTVTAKANDQIFVRLKASWNYWPQITIKKPDGTQLASDYSSSYCVVQA